jgi:hypothetical protein
VPIPQLAGEAVVLAEPVELLREEAKEGLQELFDAWINVDPETAHIDLGTLYQKVLDQKTILEVKTGIDLDSVPLPGGAETSTSIRCGKPLMILTAG